MLRIVTLILIFLSCLTIFVNAQEQSRSTEQAILQLKRELYEAARNGNATAVERIVSDDYIEIESDGNVSNKTDLIKTMKELAALPDSMRSSIPVPAIDDIKVRTYGDTVVLTGHSISRQQYSTFDDEKKRAPKEIVNEYRFTDVFVKRNGRWQIVSSQSTRIQKK